jgi:hypothetical protein
MPVIIVDATAEGIATNVIAWLARSWGIFRIPFTSARQSNPFVEAHLPEHPITELAL